MTVHMFDTDIAKEYGIFEAVLLHNLWFWIEHNKANEKNYYDGEYWTYNSTKAFNELFPYVSQKKIQRALNKLKSLGIIKTGNYNKLSYDRTLWYAFTKKGKCIMTNREMDCDKSGNGDAQNEQIDYDKLGKPIPDINQFKNKQIENTNKKQKVYFPLDEKLNDTFLDFIEMRKRIKKPLVTDRQIKIAINKIEKLSKDEFGNMNNDKAIEIIEQSIGGSWTGIYPLKEEKKQKTSGGIDWNNV